MSQQYTKKKDKDPNNGRGRKQRKQQQHLLSHSNSSNSKEKANFKADSNANAKGTNPNNSSQAKGINQTANNKSNHHKVSANNKSKASSHVTSTDLAAGTLTTADKQTHKKCNGSVPQKKRSHAATYSNMKSNSRPSNFNTHQIDKQRAERATLVLWRRPYTTLMYCNYELIQLFKSLINKLLQRKLWIAFFLIVCSMLGFLYYTPGRHQIIFNFLKNNTWFVIYWTGLGILSSVGLGTGLHTFILYLGPHIASVTLAAYECNSLNFPKPPYPDDIICPEEPYIKTMPNLWSIMSKVRLEAFLWGAGTALGELPPYFMAKAARLSGYDPDDAKELAEFEALNAKKNTNNLSIVDKGKLFVERIVERIGFFGILACASIPNPLFDLAGITCGHFLVPFWTFFGATLIGKAIIKMHIQKVFVIIAFNETLIEKAVDMMSFLPWIGQKLQEPFKDFLNKQKQRLHRHRNASIESSNLLSKIFETFVICMVCYFIVSIINSFAQSYHKRLHKKAHNTTSKKHKKSSVRLD